MSSRRIGLVVVLVALAACRLEDATLGGARCFEEIEAAEALRRHGEGDVLLVQVRVESAADRRVAGAIWLEPDAGVPDAWRNDPRSVVVLARDDADARRAAARLARAGVLHVAVVRGGIEAWLDHSAGTIEVGSR